MKKIILSGFIAIASIVQVQAQQMSGKKAMKKAKQYEEAGNYRAAVDVLSANIQNAGKSENEMYLQLGMAQLQLGLIDSSFVSFGKVTDTQNETLLQGQRTASERKGAYKLALAEGKRALNDRKFDVAKKQFNEALKSDNGNYEVYFGLAEVQQLSGSVDTAIYLYQEATKKYIATEKERAHIHEHIAECHIIQNNYVKAIESCDLALSIDPKAEEAYFLKGKAQYLQRDFQAAEQSLNTYIQTEDKHAEAFMIRGDCYMQMDRFNTAIMDYTAVVMIDSTALEAWSNRGMCWFKLKQYSAAEGDYRSLNSRFDNNYYAMNAIGNCLYAQEKYAEAIPYYEKVVKLSKQDNYSYNLAIAYYRNAQYKESIAIIDQLTEKHPLDPKYNVVKLWSLMALKEYDQAKLWMDQSIKKHPYVREYYEVSMEYYTINKDKARKQEAQRILKNIGGDAVNFDPLF